MGPDNTSLLSMILPHLKLLRSLIFSMHNSKDLADSNPDYTGLSQVSACKCLQTYTVVCQQGASLRCHVVLSFTFTQSWKFSFLRRRVKSLGLTRACEQFQHRADNKWSPGLDVDHMMELETDKLCLLHSCGDRPGLCWYACWMHMCAWWVQVQHNCSEFDSFVTKWGSQKTRCEVFNDSRDLVWPV